VRISLSFLLPLLCLLSIISASAAQNFSAREKSIFEKNLELYREGDYKQAEQNFALVVAKLPESAYITSNYLMLVKSQYKLGDYVSAIDQAKIFLSKFSNSHYRDDVLYTMGNAYYKLNRFQSATKLWISALDESNDPRLAGKIEVLVTGTVRDMLNDEDIKKLSTEIGTYADGRMLLDIAWAEKLYAEGSITKGNSILNAALTELPANKYSEQARQLLKSGGLQSSPDEKFALLLPLSGYNAEIGQAILEGAQMALLEFNKQFNLDLKIISRDYGQEIKNAILGYQELAGFDNILAVIGPIENDISAACAAVSKYEQLPLLSPTATANNLTDFSNYFFQLNAPINTTAEIIADYALDSLKLKRYATFAPIDDHFIKMVDKFKSTVETAGAEVVAEEWYYPGDQDFYKQFMNLKRRGLKLTFSDSIRQSLPLASPVVIDSLYMAYQRQEMENHENKKPAKVDSADIPVTSIDAVFIPIFKEDLQFIAPQIAYSNIQAQFLGNNDWYDSEGLKKNKNYINNIIFSASGYLNEESWDFRRFRNEFRTTFKKTPSIYAVLGYDVFRYLIQAYRPQQPQMTRQQFLVNLNNLKKYNGIYRNFDINKMHFNQYHQLLKYSFGQIIPLK
jgi:ABC-type branched-subunit amino acid transport system substrate-binding protein